MGDAGGGTEGGSFAPASHGGDEGVAGEPGVSDQRGERGPRGELLLVAVVLVLLIVLLLGVVGAVVAGNESAVNMKRVDAGTFFIFISKPCPWSALPLIRWVSYDWRQACMRETQRLLQTFEAEQRDRHAHRARPLKFEGGRMPPAEEQRIKPVGYIAELG